MSRPIKGSVARLEDQYTLIINRGSEHGVVDGMEFAVMADDGDPIIDPETGEAIGELPAEKLRVRVFDVHSKYSRAETFRQYQPPTLKFGLTPAGLNTDFLGNIESLGGDYLAKQIGALGAGALGGFDSDLLGRAIRTSIENPSPVRQEIANAKPKRPKEAPIQREVTINIGDKVIEIVA